MNKEICKRCMAVEQVASYKDDEQVGHPCPWNRVGDGTEKYDDNLWDKGMVHCPHKRQEVPIFKADAICLHLNAQKAVEEGALLPIEEVPVQV